MVRQHSDSHAVHRADDLRLAEPDSDCNTDPYPNTYIYPNADSYTYSYSHSHSHSDSDGDSNPDSDSNSNANPDSESNAYPDTNAYSDSGRDTGSFADTNAHTDSFANSDTRSFANANADADSYSDSHANPHSHANPCFNTRRDSYADADADAKEGTWEGPSSASITYANSSWDDTLIASSTPSLNAGVNTDSERQNRSHGPIHARTRARERGKLLAARTTPAHMIASDNGRRYLSGVSANYQGSSNESASFS